MLADLTTPALPADSPLLPRLRQQTAKDSRVSQELEQPQLFERAVAVLKKISERRPLLLLLDDLQWADSGSINLLFHLARRLAGASILLVGAYRQDELTAGPGDKRHPLLPLLEEFKGALGDIFLDLSREKDRSFIDQFLDSQPNRLDDSFRETLFAHTGGHPLFTVELLRDMQERGVLRLDADGYWAQESGLDWSALPARVEGVIESRIGRLEDELRDILTVAAVEGEDFTAQVVARIQEIQERLLLHTLSSELGRRHRLVEEGPAQRSGRLLLSRYRFAHALFQQYLYNELSAGERQILHGEIAAILEELYAGRLNEITIQLAWHYAEAGYGDKALPYLLQAGDRARALFAFAEAALHYQRALDI
jgi:predicted ATPase